MIKKADRLRLGFFDCILNIFIYFRQKNNENSSSREISRCQSAAGEFLTMELLTTTVANYSSSPGTVKCMFNTRMPDNLYRRRMLIRSHFDSLCL